MSEPWRDINDPGAFFKPEPEPADNTRVALTDSATKPKEKPSPVAKLTDAKFVPPQAGLKFNDKCSVQVAVKYTQETPQTRVTFKLFCDYKGIKQDLKHKIDANESGGIAKAELTLYYPDDYSDGSAEYFFTAEHCRGDKTVESDKLTLPKTSGNLVKDICEKYWGSYKDDCSGFVKAVARDLNVTLTGQANDIVDQIQKSPWKILKNGKEADSDARGGRFVVAGLKDDPNGHVVVIVPGVLAHDKYPTGYWGHLGSVGYKNTTINYSWNSTERDKVIYASIQI
jgi:hypothetical protein